jgi:hypothetical protein
MGAHIDKRLKLDKPVGTDTYPTKVTEIAQETIRANKIAIENSKTGQVTTVVAIMSIFEKIYNTALHGVLTREDCKLSQKMAKFEENRSK